MSAAHTAPVQADTVMVPAATVRKIATLVEVLLPAYTAATQKLAAAQDREAAHKAAVQAGVEQLVKSGVIHANNKTATCEKLLQPGAMIGHIVGSTLSAPEPAMAPIGTPVNGAAPAKKAASFSRDAASEAEAELNANFLRNMGLEVTDENLRGLSLQAR
jgi:hypothetical protein